MTITVTQPISAPTGLTATLAFGGTLDASTQYYYVLIAWTEQYMTPININTFGYHSEISAEGTFTTDATNRSALIQWTNSAEHTSTTRYMILLSKTSGDYASALSTIGPTTTEVTGNISDGTTGYTITANPTNAYGYHTYTMKNDSPHQLDKTTGIIKVEIDNETLQSSGIWTNRYALEAIYQAIVSAGYSNNVYWDGYNFVLKGWITLTGSSTTSIVLREVQVYFLKGGLHITNANASVTFGEYFDEYEGARYWSGTTIHLLNNRYPFRSTIESALKVYGSKITFGEGLPNTVAEVHNFSYYTGGANMFLSYEINEFKDDMIGVISSLRGVTSPVKDLKVGIGNNWHNDDSYRLQITGNTTSAYTTNARIYDTKWLTPLTGSKGMRMYVPLSGTTFSTFLYDPHFIQYSDNLPPIWYYSTNYGMLTSSSYWQVQHSLHLDVEDETGERIPNANVEMIDVRGDNALWIEHDGTADRAVTGNEYTTDRTTDANGEIDYYVCSYKVNLDPKNKVASAFCENYIKTNYYPFIITVSKEGFETELIYLETLTDKTVILLTMKRCVGVRNTIDGGLFVALNPTAGSKANMMKL